MSRQYHVLGDLRTCARCDSRCALFGQRDPETAWFGWCVLCNTTWRNRRIESVLLSVSRDFALRSLVALLGNNTAASVTLTFLQTSVLCVKYNILLRHHLDLRLLMWLCCPLEWWYESDSEGEEERIRRPVLRTLHETFISSRAFTAMCFPCPMSRRYWTLLHAVCSYLRRSQTAHTCDSSPRREHAWHLFRWAHGPWLWNEITEEWFFVNNPPAEWQCYFFRNKQGCHVHWWLSGKRWFLEPVSSEWSHFLRHCVDRGEGAWQQFLADDGPWMWNQITEEWFFVQDSLSQWQRSICSDRQGRMVYYWHSGNRWFLEMEQRPRVSDAKSCLQHEAT